MDERIRTPDFKKWGLKLRRAIETWRLPLLILALGALILLWPSGKKEAAAAAKPEAAQTEETADTQARLEQLLSSMDGVGRVELMLTTSGSEEIFYQTDTRVSGDTREETTVSRRQKARPISEPSSCATERTARQCGCASCRQFPP